MRPRFLRRNIYIDEESEFCALYKGHKVHIKRETKPEAWEQQFYITVTDLGGHYAYNGYWPSSLDSNFGDPLTMQDAIREALEFRQSGVARYICRAPVR